AVHGRHQMNSCRPALNKMRFGCVGANLRGEALACRIGKVCRNFTPVSKLFFVYPNKEIIFSRTHNANEHMRNPLQRRTLRNCSISNWGWDCCRIIFGLAGDYPGLSSTEGDACDPSGDDRDNDGDDAVKCGIAMCE